MGQGVVSIPGSLPCPEAAVGGTAGTAAEADDLDVLCRSQMDNERKSNTSKHSYSGRVHLCVARYR